MSDPFTEPRAKGTLPYHLRDDAEVSIDDARYAVLLKKLTDLHRAAGIIAKPPFKRTWHEFQRE